jgi:quinate/shikimate dehydrogenase (NAD+)
LPPFLLEAAVAKIRLGLIGDNIAASRAPDLHHAAARLCGIDVSYGRLVPRDLGLSFDAVVDRARNDGLRGLNITYPYKERILPRVTIEDSAVQAIGACNTVLFGEPTLGMNTDYTGFVAAYQERFGEVSPGVVAIAGCGGAGKAVGFALASLGATKIRLFDADHAKARALQASIQDFKRGVDVVAAPSLAEACEGANGILNCTPLGMVGYGGNAFEGIRINDHSWIFDAVYTPLDTPFLKAGEAAGVETLSGYELFLYQGIHAFRLFTGHDVDGRELRRALA